MAWAVLAARHTDGHGLTECVDLREQTTKACLSSGWSCTENDKTCKQVPQAKAQVPCTYLLAKGDSLHARVRDVRVDVSIQFLAGVCSLAGILQWRRRRQLHTARCAAAGLHALLETRAVQYTCSWTLHFRSATSCDNRRCLPPGSLQAVYTRHCRPPLQRLPSVAQTNAVITLWLQSVRSSEWLAADVTRSNRLWVARPSKITARHDAEATEEQ